MLSIKIKSGVLKVEGILLSRYQLISEDIILILRVDAKDVIILHW